MKDELGERMKGYYEVRTQSRLPRRTYTIIRLDGKAFHTYTRNLKKPFDETLVDDMFWTTKYLCENIQGCKFGYTQSDEISLLLTDFDRLSTDAWFDGNVQKIVSVSASMATAIFNERREPNDYGVEQPLAFFDSRTFTIPTAVEVENYFIWRQKDAIRNSISMLAQSLYSHNQLHGKNTTDMLNMIKDTGKDWEKVPEWIRRGHFVTKSEIEKGFCWNSAAGTPDFVEQREYLTEQVPRLEDMEE